MKITDLNVTMFSRQLPVVRYVPTEAGVGGRSALGLVTIETDAGLSGQCFVGTGTRSAEIDAHTIVAALKPVLMGQDPLDRERLYGKLLARLRNTTWRCIGAIDVALWDLCGKIANLPLYQLLGAYRDAVPAYASSPGLESIEDYVGEATRMKEQGFRAYKIHPPRVGWQRDAKISAEVRKAVGNDFTLMIDCSWQYKYADALRLGRVVEELGFYWYEDPLPNDDFYNYRKLREKLDIPLVATQDSPGSFHSYAEWITAGATDCLRGDVAVKGGLTPCLKAAHLAEAFRMNFEMHHGGNSLNNIANLHLICALPNSEYFEILLPDDVQKCGVVDDLSVDAQGLVHVPKKPGLGVELDMDFIRANTFAVLS